MLGLLLCVRLTDFKPQHPFQWGIVVGLRSILSGGGRITSMEPDWRWKIVLVFRELVLRKAHLDKSALVHGGDAARTCYAARAAVHHAQFFLGS